MATAIRFPRSKRKRRRKNLSRRAVLILVTLAVVACVHVALHWKFRIAGDVFVASCVALPISTVGLLLGISFDPRPSGLQPSPKPIGLAIYSWVVGILLVVWWCSLYLLVASILALIVVR